MPTTDNSSRMTTQEDEVRVKLSLVSKIHDLLKTPESQTQQDQQENSASQTDENNGYLLVPFGPERYLTAWVLLTRLDQNDLDNVWQQYGRSVLEPYAVEELLQYGIKLQEGESLDSEKEGSPPNELCADNSGENRSLPASRGLYLRLVAQVMVQLSNSTSVPSWACSSTSSLLGPALVKEWQRFSSDNNSGDSNPSQVAKSNPVSVHLDVLRALEVWIEQDPKKIAEMNVLEIIWYHYISLATQIESSSSQATTSFESKESCDYPAKEKDGDTECRRDWELMSQTLLGILEGTNTIGATASNNASNDDAIHMTLLNLWHEMVITIFQSYGNDSLPDTLLSHIIEWTTHPKHIHLLPPTASQAWHEWILSMIQTRIAFDKPFRVQLFQQTRIIEQMNQLLLAYVVSPTEDNHNITGGFSSNNHSQNSSLRALAWQTMVTLVESCGWQWVLMVTMSKNLTNKDSPSSATSTTRSGTSSSSRLGMASNLCTWIRLANGEWRIQLQAVQNSGNNETSTSTTPATADRTSDTSTHQQIIWQQATGLPVGNACARLLIGVVHFCVQLEEEKHHPRRRLPSLSVDALLHLKTSLQGALFTTVEYLQERQRESSYDNDDDGWNDFYDNPKRTSSTSATAAAASFEPIAIRLLGTLLMEVDIWMLQPDETTAGPTNTLSGASSDGSSPTVATTELIQGILDCLQYILPDSQDYSLLPGLVSILAGAEEQIKSNPRQVAAAMSGLWDPLVDYLEGYWQRDTTSSSSSLGDKLNDSVAWACSCTEMYVSLDSPNEVTTDPTFSASSTVVRHRHRRLALGLIEWIQTVLQVDSQELWTPPSQTTTKSKSSSTRLTLHKLQSYLSLAVGCYMTLSKSGEQPPGEHESRVIFRALQVCEMQQASTPSMSRLDVP